MTGLGGHVLGCLAMDDGRLRIPAQENDAERCSGRPRRHSGARRVNARNAATGARSLPFASASKAVPSSSTTTAGVRRGPQRCRASSGSGRAYRTVLVTSTVQRQVAGLFIVEDKGVMSSRELRRQ